MAAGKDGWEEILSFWFGGATDALQKRLWFCADGSPEQRRADETVAERFGDVVGAAEQGLLDWWAERGGARGRAALIITLDQLGRHLHRHRQDTADGRPPASADAAALRHCRLLVDDEAAWDELTAPALVFALMPLRHDRAGGDLEVQRANHRLVLELLTKRIDSRRDEVGRVVDRFRVATVRRLQALCDIAPADGDILEWEEFDPTPEVAERLPCDELVRGVARFFAARRADIEAADGTVVVSLSGGVDSMVIAHIMCHLRDHPAPVSRPKRGGRKHLGAAAEAADRRMRRDTFEGAALAGMVRRVVAVHVDYANRHESAREAAFVRDWCARRRIDFRIRVIDEVTRGVTKRDEYEAISRKARYDLYRHVIEDTRAPAICLGHHGDDVVENLLSNATGGCGVLDLSGMNEEGVVEGVPVWRPLLPFRKPAVFEYAHAFGVPYFKDTTPSWSTRGKLRRGLLPAMCDTYGNGSVGNLRTLAAESDELRALVEARIIDPFWREHVKVLPLGAQLNCSSHRDAGRLFWREVYKRVMHSVLGCPMLTDKSMIEVAMRTGLLGFTGSDAVESRGVLHAPEPKPGWLELGSHIKGFYEAGTVTVLRPQSPFTGGARVPICAHDGGDAQEVEVGGWGITAKCLPPGHPDTTAGADPRWDDRRALPAVCRAAPFSSLEQLLSARLRYHVAVRSGHGGALEVLDPSHAGARLPIGWRSVPSQLRPYLPAAAPSDEDGRPREGEATFIVEVVMVHSRAV